MSRATEAREAKWRRSMWRWRAGFVALWLVACLVIGLKNGWR